MGRPTCKQGQDIVDQEVRLELNQDQRVGNNHQWALIQDQKVILEDMNSQKGRLESMQGQGIQAEDMLIQVWIPESRS